MRIPKATRLGCVALGALLAAALPALAQTEGDGQGSGVRISRSAICTQVEERAPVGEGTSFRPDVGQLFAYTQVEGVTSPTRITHVWQRGDEEIYRRDLQVNDSGWRTWTSKTIDPSWTGPWKVMVLDEDGNPLATMEFTIEESGAAAEPEAGGSSR